MVIVFAPTQTTAPTHKYFFVSVINLRLINTGTAFDHLPLPICLLLQIHITGVW
jgi:hypothetical protein